MKSSPASDDTNRYIILNDGGDDMRRPLVENLYHPTHTHIVNSVFKSFMIDVFFLFFFLLEAILTRLYSFSSAGVDM